MNLGDDEKQKIINRAFELGYSYEKTVRGCCQCTIAAIQDALGVKNDSIFKAGSGLTAGGGISCQGSCGGYIGGVMVMSSIFGRNHENWDTDKDGKDCAHRMAFALLQLFNREFGSAICKDVHSVLFGRTFDLNNVEDRQAFEELGAHAEICTTVVGRAASWATKLILDELSRRNMSLDDARTPAM